MTKIDWSGELEAVNRDNNEVHTLDPMRPNNNRFWPFVAYSQSRGEDFYLNPDKDDVNSGNSTGNWYIRNRQPTINDRLARLEAFVARVASDEPGGRDRYRSEAKTLVAEIAPVDPDLIEARKIAMDEYQPSAWNDEQWESRVMAGDEDEDRSVRSALAGIRRGRALERGES